MLAQRLNDHIEPLLRPGEVIEAAMAGFRPLSRSFALIAVFPAVFAGFAVSTAAGYPSWVGGGVGGGVGAGLAAWLDQRRARSEHGGKGMSVGLVVTSHRLFVLELDTGVMAASVAGVGLEAGRDEITGVETERMQGSGLKRLGVVIALSDGSTERVIPARSEVFLRALEG